MPTVKKETLFAAVGVVIDDLLGPLKDGEEEERTTSFQPNEDGSFLVTEPPNRAAVRKKFSLVIQGTYVSWTMIVTKVLL